MIVEHQKKCLHHSLFVLVLLVIFPPSGGVVYPSLYAAVVNDKA